MRYKKVVAKVRERRKAKKQAMVFLVCLLIINLFFSVYSIIEYESYNVSYDDLKYEQLTFEEYEVKYIRRHTTYDFYFEEYDDIFWISSISKRKLNEISLNKLRKGDTVKVYYKNNSRGIFYENYSFEICEIKSGNKTILSLNDYKKANQNNQLIGIIICPVCCLIFTTFIYTTSKYM